MNPVAWAKRHLARRLRSTVRNEVRLTLEDMLPIVAQLIQFQNSGEEERQFFYDHTHRVLGDHRYFERLVTQLQSIGVTVEDIDIDASDFESWLSDFGEIKEHYRAAGDAWIENCLEHYLSYRYLEISQSDVYVDVAASQSPWANALNRRHIRSYMLDLAYAPGVHDMKIGADAGDTRLPSGFATAMSIQSALQCFAGDADTRFVLEAARILRANGRYAIVPLYLEDTHFVAVSPYFEVASQAIDEGARKVWREDGLRLPVSRHYSPDAFKNRIYARIPEGMLGKVLYFRNLLDVMNRFPGQRMYCFFMFLCAKSGMSPS